MKTPFLAPSLALAFLGTGCATLFKGTDRQIEFWSEPAGATVEVGDQVLVTPAEATLSNQYTYVALIHKEGYEPEAELVANHRIDKTYWCNFGLLTRFFGGMLVDLQTGAYAALEPTRVETTLQPEEASP